MMCTGVSAPSAHRGHSTTGASTITTPAPAGTGTVCIPRSLGGTSRRAPVMARR